MSHALRARWLPLVIAVACLGCLSVFYTRLLSDQRHEQQALADAAAEWSAAQIREVMREPLGAFGHMVRRLESASQLRPVEWEDDARSYLTDVSGIAGLALFDAAGQPERVMAGSLDEQAFRAMLSEEGLQESGRPVTGGSIRPTVHPARTWGPGRSGILLSSPIQRDGVRVGLLVAAVEVGRVLRPVIEEGIRRGYSIEVSEGSLSLAEPETRLTARNVPKAYAAIDSPGMQWKISVHGPLRGLTAPAWSDLNLAVLLTGLLVSLLVPASVGLAQAAWMRAREAEAAKRSFELEAIERQRSEDAMSQNEERFRLAFNGAPIGMALLTRDGRWLRVNDSMCRILGYCESELLESDFQTLTHPDDLKADLNLVRQVLAGEINSYTIDKRYFHKDGRIIPASLYVSFVRDRPGRPGYFVAQVQDISQRIEMDRMKREFISTVSHELRTPLTSIAGSLGLLAGGVAGELPAQAAHLVEIAERNSERLVRLVDDILDIEKAAAGKMTFALELQPLEPIVLQAIEANQEYAERFGVKLELAQTVRDVAVRVERDRLIQVLTNLISNAAKYSPPGERVSLGIRTEGSDALVSVQDRGPGIAESFRGQIFQQFSQADNSDSRRKGGTGLGLCITKAFMECLGGCH